MPRLTHQFGHRRNFKLAKKSLIVKAQRTPKYPVRAYNRCKLCGRSRTYMRKFGMSPDLLPRECTQGADPRRYQVKLVAAVVEQAVF